MNNKIKGLLAAGIVILIFSSPIILGLLFGYELLEKIAGILIVIGLSVMVLSIAVNAYYAIQDKQKPELRTKKS